MAKHAAKLVFDADKAEPTEVDAGTHCFIVRFGDDQFDGILEHQARLSRVLRRPISRAAAVREIVGRILPKRRRGPDPRQLGMFTSPFRSDPKMAADVRRVVEQAEKRTERKLGK